MSNFNKVQNFNKTFGVKVYDNPKPNIFDKNPDMIKLRLDLVMEECKELVDAVNNKDFIETNDALADILYVVYGFFDAIGVDADKAFDIVHKSNMSKVCDTEEQAKKTIKWYNTIGSYDSPSYKKTPCGKYWMIYNKSSNKVLKNCDYKRVDFNEILK